MSRSHPAGFKNELFLSLEINKRIELLFQLGLTLMLSAVLLENQEVSYSTRMSLPVVYMRFSLYLGQTSDAALIAATAYLDLFLRSITDANLMKVFLKFILVERSDGVPILELLVSRIAQESQVEYCRNIVLSKLC